MVKHHLPLGEGGGEGQSYFPCYDGNGNITEYLDANGIAQAHYEYDAFGNTVVSTGTKANDFAYRFSTKPRDTISGLCYYGYRWYDPRTGRCSSRDPIGEGVIIDYNLYAFTANRSASRIDILGLRTQIFWEDYWKKYQEKYPDMNEEQRSWAERTLSLGCVGVTSLLLGAEVDNIFCYQILKKDNTVDSEASLKSAQKRQEELNENDSSCCAQIYSIHFWNDGKGTKSPEIKPVGKRGKVKMGNWNESAKGKGKIPFDYGFLNSDGTITHANHDYNPVDPSTIGVGRDGKPKIPKGKYRPDGILTDTDEENRAKIYTSSMTDWIESYDEFNDEVWCTQCTQNKAGKRYQPEWRIKK